jgi:lysylphosphatidylglycerol synthetase-like protein (DUF2156 family)
VLNSSIDFHWTMEPENSLSITESIRRWGCSASVGLLDPVCKIFNLPNFDGVIGYRIEFGCAVVYGDPVCPPHELNDLVKQFHLFCQKQYLKVIYTAASQKFAKAVMKKSCHALIEFGEELVLDPYQDPLEITTGHARRSLKSKINQCCRHGVQIKEYFCGEAKIEKEIEAVGNSWLQARRGPQIYIARVNLFANRNGKRWFYAKLGEKIVGTLMLNQLESAKGWLLNLLMATPDAPPGTSELLVLAGLEALRKEGCHYFTFGAAPAAQLGRIEGLSPLSAWIARKAYDTASSFFKLNKRTTYWKKFQPRSEPSYLIFENAHLGLREVFSIMRAFNVSVKI